MLFHYQAAKDDGEITTGDRESVDRLALARDLKEGGLTLLRAEDASEIKQLSRWQKITAVLGRVSLKEKILFAGTLSSMLNAGLSLTRALEVIKKQTTNKVWSKVIEQILSRITQGGSLHEALADHPKVFPKVFTAMVSAGEQSGNLPKSLEVVRGQLAKSYELRRRVRGAMIYPAIIVSVIVVVGILLLVYLVPNLTALFSELDVELPLTTQIMIGTSNFFLNYPLLIIGFVLMFILLISLTRRSSRGKKILAKFWLKLPVFKTIIHDFNSAMTMRTLSSLIGSGVGLVEGLRITNDVLVNPLYYEALSEATKAVQTGSTLSSIFENHGDIYPPMVTELIQVGEETGNLSEMLEKGAIFFEDEVDQLVKNLSTIIEPVLMVFIGIAVGFFAISVIGPMYSLADAL